MESASRVDSAVQAGPPATRRVTIDFQVGVEPLTGILHLDQESYPFTGWLSLATALGKATGEDRSAATAVPHAPA